MHLLFVFELYFIYLFSKAKMMNSLLEYFSAKHL